MGSHHPRAIARSVRNYSPKLCHQLDDADHGGRDFPRRGGSWSHAAQPEQALTPGCSFCHPNPDSPANRDAAVMFKKDRKLYNETVIKQINKS